MVSAVAIRKLVSNYVSRQMSLSEFADQFAPVFYDIEDDGEPAAIALSYRVESELAKHGEGLIDEPVLRNSLIACIEAEVIQSPIFSRVEVDPGLPQSESQNCGASISSSDPIDALAIAS